MSYADRPPPKVVASREDSPRLRVVVLPATGCRALTTADGARIEHRSRRGLGGMLVVLGVLSLVIALGFTFSRFSRQTGLDVYRQVDTLRARWLARGALAKAFVVLRREMEAHYYGWSFPEQRVGRLLPEQFDGALGDGTWKVVSVEPLTFHRGEATIGPYRNRPYRRHGESLGYYDIFKIVTEGYVPRTTTGVRMTSLVKIIRKRVAPQ